MKFGWKNSSEDREDASFLSLISQKFTIFCFTSFLYLSLVVGASSRERGCGSRYMRQRFLISVNQDLADGLDAIRTRIACRWRMLLGSLQTMPKLKTFFGATEPCQEDSQPRRLLHFVECRCGASSFFQVVIHHFNLRF